MKKEISAAALSSALLLGGDAAPAIREKPMPTEKQATTLGCTVVAMSARGGELTFELHITGIRPEHLDRDEVNLWFEQTSRHRHHHSFNQTPADVKQHENSVMVTSTHAVTLPELADMTVVSSAFADLRTDQNQPFSGVNCDGYQAVTFDHQGRPANAKPFRGY